MCDLCSDVVRSLSLPGSYGDKITHLGRSLLAFSRLKHLDLSRNAIESLQGLDHLKQLETLNLYPYAGSLVIYPCTAIVLSPGPFPAFQCCMLKQCATLKS